MTDPTTPNPAPNPALDAARRTFDAQLDQMRRALKVLRRAQTALTVLSDLLTDSEDALTAAVRWSPLIEAGVPPAACVPIEKYEEEHYHYVDDISADPMWGIDAGHDWSNDETMSYAQVQDWLGWYIRTTPRTPEGLARLQRIRDWHRECRAFGLDPLSDPQTLEAFGAYQDALARALTDDERAAAEATFTRAMRDAVAKDEADFRKHLERRALRGSDDPWDNIDAYAARRARWVKPLEPGVAE